MSARKSFKFIATAVAVGFAVSGAAAAPPSAARVVMISPSAGMDPLVAVSLLGTAGSAAAVQSVASQETGQVNCPPGTVLRPPLANEPAGQPTCVTGDVPVAPVPPPAPSVVAFLPVIAAAAAVAGLASGGHGNGTGNLAPISPA